MRIFISRNTLVMSDYEAQLHQATGNDNKMLDPDSMRKLARQSRLNQNLKLTLVHLFAKYQEPKDKWRKSLKALVLTRYILEVGNPKFHKELKRKSFFIQTLLDRSLKNYYEDGQRSEIISC